jgi:hypothetical protein
MIAIQQCFGGTVQFGMTGNGNTVYAVKKQLCISSFQDTRYGKNMRVHTVAQKDASKKRCTVCGYGNGVVRP